MNPTHNKTSEHYPFDQSDIRRMRIYLKELSELSHQIDQCHIDKLTLEMDRIYRFLKHYDGLGIVETQLKS
jgi:hypothetical protein